MLRTARLRIRKFVRAARQLAVHLHEAAAPIGGEGKDKPRRKVYKYLFSVDHRD